jgi:hypothetical protein
MYLGIESGTNESTEFAEGTESSSSIGSLSTAGEGEANTS